MKIKRLLE